MEPGEIVEYLEGGKIQAGVCLDLKKGRLKVLTENDRELGLSSNRIIHTSTSRIDPSKPRSELVKRLREIVTKRESLKEGIIIPELWDLPPKETIIKSSS